MGFLGFYDYTVVLTLVSLAVSVYGMTGAIQGHFRTAILCLAISGLCDLFDGKIARTKKDRTEDEKKYGIELDSLCDVLCFGAFPIILCYCLGMNKTIGVGVLIVYGMASVIRLAFFNVMEEKRQSSEAGNREYYQGLPITSIAIILPFVFLFRMTLGPHFLFIVHIVVIIVAILFITDFRIKKPQNPVVVLILAVVALALAKIFRLI